MDIAYNSGLIGLVLFYGIFASMFLRLYRAPRRSTGGATRHPRRAGYRLFISFAGTIHYGAFLAAFLALSVGILKRA